MLVLAIFLLAVLSGSSGADFALPIPPTRPSSFILFGHELLLRNCNNTNIMCFYEALVCGATIFASTWVTVHPNLPHPQDSGWVRFKRQVRVMLYGLLAPELVLYWAWCERREAGRAAKVFNTRIYGQIAATETFSPSRMFEVIREWFRGSGQTVKPYVWTLSHGFFVGMGGFVLYDGAVPLHPLTLAELIQGGEFEFELPVISEVEITDKSKEDFLTKLLYIQAVWFVVRCLTKPQVTHLDVVTLVFVAMNATTCLLWWKKPQNARVGFRVPLRKGVNSHGHPKL